MRHRHKLTVPGAGKVQPAGDTRGEEATVAAKDQQV